MGNFTFGFLGCSLPLVLMLNFALLLQAVYTYFLYPKTLRTTNQISMYVLAIETWNTLFTMTTAFYTTLLWNNTA